MLANLDIPLGVRILLRLLPPAIGVITLVIMLVRHHDDDRASRSTRYWVILFIVLLLAAAISCVTGVVKADTLAVLAYSLVCTLAGLLVTARDELLDMVDDLVVRLAVVVNLV